MNFDILNNKPLEFFNQDGELMGKIFISGSTGDLYLTPVSGSDGDVILGNRDTVGDVEIGLPSAEVNFKLMGGGTISSNGNTLTIGDSTVGDQVIIGVPLTASLVQSSSFAITASHALNGGGGSTPAGTVSGSAQITELGFVTSSATSSFSTVVANPGSSGGGALSTVTIDGTNFSVGGGGGGSSIFTATAGYQQTINNLIISESNASSSLSVINSGSTIFNVQGSVGQLFEVQDGLDGVLMSVNDISGIPILTVSSSGDVILAEGSTLQGTAATASFVAGVSAAFPFTGSGGIKGSLDITGSGDDIFKVRSSSGSLFSVDDGLDGILMSVNDISGLPLFEVSSSGDVEISTGNISGSASSTASFGHLLVNGVSISGSGAGGGGGSSFTAAGISGSFGAPSASFSTRVTANESSITTLTSNISSLTDATGSYATTGSVSLNNLTISNLSGSLTPGDGSTISYTVTVVDSGGDKFAIDLGSGAQTTPAFSLLAGNTYRFTQDDNSNNNHPFGFAKFSDDSSYTDGVTYNGTAGQAGSYAQIVVTNSTPKLKYRCTVHGVGMGGDAAVTITTGSLIQNGFLQVSGSTRLSGSLSLQGSGSTLFEVIGSEGTIFSLDDDLDGELFTVNDRSGIPQLLVSSSGRIEAEEGEAVIRSQRPIVTVATNPFTASADTVGKYFRVGGNITCSIFVTASAHCPIGAEFDFFQTSSVGNMLFETGSGVTLNSKNSNLNLAGQFSSATLKYIGLDEWDLMGDLT